MKKNMVLWQIIGFAATSLLGVLLHFLYDWTKSSFVALFSAVNESTWEHMKLIFFPMFIFALLESLFIGKEYKSFWCIKLRGTLLGLILIPVLFYTLNGVFGTTPGWVNIATFFITAAIAYIYETRQLLTGNIPCKSYKSAFWALCFIAIAFGVFTFIPPHIPLFEDPISKSFGIQMK